MTSVCDLDPRFLLARPDLAEQALEGLVPADAYRPTVARRCVLGFAPITDSEGAPVGEILFGELFDVLDEVDGRCWGRARRDGTVGHIEGDLLGLPDPVATQRIANVEEALPLNALVGPGDVEAQDNLADFHTFDADLAETAKRLVGGRYRSGGRTRAGLDAAGLVQQALFANGKPGPRPLDLQARLGESVDQPRRGDLVIWPDRHAGVLIDGGRIIHACPDAGEVVIEAFDQVDARWQGRGTGRPILRRI